MLKYTMEMRKPTIVWRVEFKGRIGHVLKNEDTSRAKRWQLTEGDQDIAFFKSRRAAFYFFETGKKFKTKPVYAGMRGGGSKRVR